MKSAMLSTFENWKVKLKPILPISSENILQTYFKSENRL